MLDHQRISLVTLGLVFVLCALSVAQDKSSKEEAKENSKDEKVIHVGVAVPANQSRRIVDTNWAKQQLVREIRALRKEKHSPILIEPVALESRDREDALEEAAKKDCDYVVTTLVVDPLVPGEVMVGPGGLPRSPQIIGNANPQENIAVRFVLSRLGSGRNLAEGMAASPAGDNEATSATTDAMRIVATRVAHELRRERVPMPE